RAGDKTKRPRDGRREGRVRPANDSYPRYGRGGRDGVSRFCRSVSRHPHSFGNPTLARGNSYRGDPYSPDGGSSVYGETDCASEDLRRSGGDRHRERPAIQGDSGAQCRIARSPGASDGDRRSARYHQPLADGCAAGARCDRRERGKSSVELMTWYCGSARGTALSRGRILVPYPYPRTASRSVLMSHSIAGCVSMERFTFRMSASGTTSKS